MPYINAELLKRERLSLKNHGSDVEVNKEESTKLHLSYSPDLTYHEVMVALKLIMGPFNAQGKSEKQLPRVANDPEIRFKKMVAVARDVRGPYVVPGSHRHRAQQVILANGHGQYEV